MKKASILIFQNKNKEILLLKTVKEGKWSLPGGKSEGQESYEETLIREVREETGYQIEDVSKCKYFREDATYGNGQEFHSVVYLLEVEKMFIPKLSLEHSRYKWIQPKEAAHTLELRGNFTYSVMLQLLTGKQMFWPIFGQDPDSSLIQNLGLEKKIPCEERSEILMIENGIIEEIADDDEECRVLTLPKGRSIIYRNVDLFINFKEGQKIMAGTKLGKSIGKYIKLCSYNVDAIGGKKFDSVNYLKSICIQ